MNCVTSLLFSAPVQTWTYMGYIDKAEDIYYNLQEKKKAKKKAIVKLLWCTSATARITAVSLIIFTAT